MRVTLIVEPLWHRVPGGTAVVTAELVQRLARRDDVELDVVSASRRWPGFRERSSDFGEALADLVVREALLPRPLLYEAWSRWGRPDVAASDSHLIHSPMLPAPTRSRVPVVVTLHDLAWVERPSDFPERARKLYSRMFERIVDEAAAILCSSQSTLDAAVAAGLDSKRAHLVPLAARPLSPPPDPAAGETSPSDVADLQARFGIDGPFVLSVGTAEPRKNLSGLIEAYRRTRLSSEGVSLVVAGPVGWQMSMTSELDRLEPGVRKQIKAIGRVEDSDLGLLYRRCVAFAYPSFSEGFGLPVLEALDAGAPVLTSATTATAEVAGDAGVLVDPDSIDDIAGGLESVVFDEAVRTRLMSAIPAQLARHSWQAHVDKTVAVYRQVGNR